MTLSRRAALTRRAPLTTRAPLRRGDPLQRKTPPPNGTPRPRKPPASTGPSGDQRDVVLDRDTVDGVLRCVICGRPLDRTPGAHRSDHHVEARGMGGRRGAARAAVNEPQHRLTLCGDGTSGCHGWVTNTRGLREHFERLGWVGRRNGVRAGRRFRIVWSWRGWLLLSRDGDARTLNRGGPPQLPHRPDDVPSTLAQLADLNARRPAPEDRAFVDALVDDHDLPADAAAREIVAAGLAAGVAQLYVTSLVEDIRSLADDEAGLRDGSVHPRDVIDDDPRDARDGEAVAAWGADVVADFCADQADEARDKLARRRHATSSLAP